ncbi:MAG TPA: 16S rRNA (guanine(966)-N(2))-methyltransferase RsmD [Caldimonas sp.]|nr:16S rRNA (guanine(966)-N(2))-methyltransferase RsmD [Caldimonas sp.]HEX2542975.1 16S rRNA (guanine(966)-N(2))-methyltransferase RsmD [Caldimonas sp.]
MKAGRRPATTSGAALPREVRIVGGAWKRTRLPVIDRSGLRPTPDRVRETLFNWLGQSVPGWRCLDAFAGSGALGFEAASRGAAAVVLLDRDPAVVASLRAVKARLDATTVEIERADALPWMARVPAASMDLVFLDPPFESALLGPALPAAARIVREGGYLYVEAAAPVDPAGAGPEIEVFRSGRAGAVHFQLLRRLPAGQSLHSANMERSPAT